MLSIDSHAFTPSFRPFDTSQSGGNQSTGAVLDPGIGAKKVYDADTPFLCHDVQVH